MEGGWAEIPDDILDLINGHLDMGDRIKLSNICKAWSTPSWKPTGGSPCFISLAEDNQTCTMIDPLRKKAELAIDVPHLPDSSRVVASNHGWLLLLGFDYSIVFFHPFSKSTIKLPRHACSIPDYYAFSSPPTSPDCVVVSCYAFNGYAPVSICRRGDNSWKQFEFNERGSFSRSSAKPVIANGSMYCLGRDGTVGVFDLAAETWRTFVEPFNLKLDFHAMYLATFDGDLLAVCMDKTDKEKAHLLKMDLIRTSENRWVEILQSDMGLGGKCFFAGKAASMCSAAASPDAGDRIYFPMIRGDKEEFVCYSFANGELCPMKILDGVEDLDGIHGAWIEPKLVKFAYEELQWREEEDDFYYSIRDLFQY